MPSDTKSPFLLLVEDSDDDAYFFARALERSGIGCALTHLTDGAQAAEFLQNARAKSAEELPRTIFLDLKMPVLNGFEFLDWMGKQTFPARVPVIVLSGSDRADDKERAARLGAAGYLVKPVLAGDLHQLLRDVCPRELGAHP